MTGEKISVIIPAYNVEDYVGRCLESCIRQTYQNLEIIVIDDESTDHTLEICKKYAECDDRVRVISAEHGGLSRTRNKGLQEATGEYLAFLDSDDFIRPNMYETLYCMLDRTAADVAVCDYYKGNYQDLAALPAMPESQRSELRVFTGQEMLENWHGRYTRVETVVWNKLYRRNMWLEETGKLVGFPEGVLFEDTHITHMIIDKADKIVYTDEKMYVYFERKESIVNTGVTCRMAKDNMVAQDKRLQFFREKGYTDACERLMLGQEKFRMLYIMKLKSSEQDVQMKKRLCKAFRRDYPAVVKSPGISVKDKVLLGVFRNTVGRVIGD